MHGWAGKKIDSSDCKTQGRAETQRADSKAQKMTFCPKAMGQTQWNWALVFTALFMGAKDKMQNLEPAQDGELKRKPPAKSYSCQKGPHFLREDKLGTPALMWTYNSNSHCLGD